MTRDLSDIELNYPSANSLEEIKQLLAAYKAAHPEEYAKWEEAEQHPEQYLDDGLREIAAHGRNFLARNVRYSSNIALSSAWGAMRELVIKAVWGTKD